MRSRNFYFLILLVFLCQQSIASYFRAGGIVGAGASGAKNKGTTRVESPFAFQAFIDYSMSPRFTLGAEHERSLGPTGTSVGLTGVSSKYYLYTPQPQELPEAGDQIQTTTLIQKNIVPYIGFAMGFAQASFPQRNGDEADVLVVAPYVAAKGGFEYPLWGKWGARSEFVYGTSVGGSGQAEVIHLLFGLYYLL